MHVCCAVIYNEFDGNDDDFNNIVEHHTGFGFDYATTVEENEKSVKRFDGFILKENADNEFVYKHIDGFKVAYKAKIDDVDWKETFKYADFYAFANSSMCFDEMMFWNSNTQKINLNEFHKLAKRLLKRNDMVQMVDIHV